MRTRIMVHAPFSPAARSRRHRLAAGLADWLGRAWRPLFALALALFVGLPVLAPLLAAAGFDHLALTIYGLYRLTCHQLPERSYFLFGHPLAYCQRDTALYTAMLLGTLASGRWRAPGLTGRRALLWLLLAGLPLALDGGTQALGWRESTWYLRTLTGGLFGFVVAWVGCQLMAQTLAQTLASPHSPKERTGDGLA
jgi:uncharacterized membrane protein